MRPFQGGLEINQLSNALIPNLVEKVETRPLYSHGLSQARIQQLDYRLDVPPPGRLWVGPTSFYCLGPL